MKVARYKFELFVLVQTSVTMDHIIVNCYLFTKINEIGIKQVILGEIQQWDFSIAKQNLMHFEDLSFIANWN